MTKSLLNGLAQVHFEDVVCCEALMKVKLRDRAKAIKKMIVERWVVLLIDAKEEEDEQAVVTKKKEKGTRKRKVKEKVEID